MTRESVAQSLESNRKISSLDKNVRDLIHVVKEHGENIRELFANSSSGASKAELLAAMTAIRTERARGNGSGNGAPDILMDRILSLEKEKVETAKETKTRLGNLEQEIKQLKTVVFGMESKLNDLKSMGSFKPSKPVETKVVETVIVQQADPTPTPVAPKSALTKEFVHKPLPTKKVAQIQEDDEIIPISPPKQIQSPKKEIKQAKPKHIAPKPIEPQPQELSQKSTDSGGSSVSITQRRMSLGLPGGAVGAGSNANHISSSSSSTVPKSITTAENMKNEQNSSGKTRMRDKVVQNALKNNQPDTVATDKLVTMNDSTSIPGTAPASASASIAVSADALHVSSSEEELVQASISTLADSTTAIPTELSAIVDLKNNEEGVLPSTTLDHTTEVGNQSQNYHQMMAVSQMLEHKMQTIESSLTTNARRIDKTIEMVVSQTESTNRLRVELNSTYEAIQADFDSFKARMHDLDGQRAGKIDKVHNLVDTVENELMKLNRRTTELHDAHHDLREHHRKTTLNMQIFGTPHVEVPPGYGRGGTNTNNNQEYGKTGGYGRKMHLSVDPVGQTSTQQERPSTYGYDGETSHSTRGGESGGRNIHIANTANTTDSIRQDRKEYKKLVNEIHELKTGLLQQAAKFVTIGDKGENTTDRLKNQAQEIKQLRRELHSVRQILAATVGNGSPTTHNQRVSVVGISIDANNNYHNHNHHNHHYKGYRNGVNAEASASSPDGIRTPALLEYGPGGLVTESVAEIGSNSFLIPDISNPASINHSQTQVRVGLQQPQSDGTKSTIVKGNNNNTNDNTITDEIDKEENKEKIKPSIVATPEERQMDERLLEEIQVERRQYFNLDKMIQNSNNNTNKTGSKLSIYKKPRSKYVHKATDSNNNRKNGDSDRSDAITPPVADTAWMTAYRFKEETQRPGTATHAEMNDNEELVDKIDENQPISLIQKNNENVTKNNSRPSSANDPADLEMIDSRSQKELSIASGYIDGDSTDSRRHTNTRPHPPSSPIGHGASHGGGARQGRALHPQEDTTILSEELKKNTATILFKIPDFGTTNRE